MEIPILTDPRDCTWFQYLRRLEEPRVRLFCFPYAGGSAFVYRDWQALLPAGVEVWPVELPGRGARFKDSMFRRADDLVKCVAEVMSRHLTIPYALFGHSMGGLISFELARHLTADYHRAPAHLFLAGRRAPHLRSTREPFYGLPRDEFVRELVRLNGTPREILNDPEVLDLLIPLLRADFELVQSHESAHSVVLQCPITVYGGSSDIDLPHEALSAWREYTTGRFTLTVIEGDHFFVARQRERLLASMSEEFELLLRRMRHCAVV
jgi:medium-chain acyl-[acyl-carrier-protein] hydrolase